MHQLTETGNFYIGVNYWASHAGTNMWSDWDAACVEKDLAAMRDNGISMLRVFPLWPDFQPLKAHYNNRLSIVEYRLGEEPLSDDEAGRCGISTAAIERFSEFLRLAQKYGMQVIVSLITGWMSGRLFLPPAFEGKNALTDPEVIKWEVRFVKYFVTRFKDNTAICAWDLGNECNCLATGAASKSEAWMWTAAISDAIRVCDSSRPVISGLDFANAEGEWTVFDQAEHTDILTTHPYHIFYTANDPMDSMRPALYPVSNALMMAGLGQKPCMVEEIGTTGYLNCSEQSEARYMNLVLYSMWVRGLDGLFWWCAFDQGRLRHTPYDWNSIGSDYGLFRYDRTVKPVGKKAKVFLDTVAALPFRRLPERIMSAVCIVTGGFGKALPTLANNVTALGVQAGMEIQFAYADAPLPEAQLYLMPCVKKISFRRLRALLERVQNGATLYLSMDGEFVRDFPEITGIHVSSREKDGKTDFVRLDGATLPLRGTYRYNIERIDGTVLAKDEAGRPALVEHTFGKGRVYCLLYPLEHEVAQCLGAFHREDAPDYAAVYRMLMRPFAANLAVCERDAWMGVTEHPFNGRQRLLVAVNYHAEKTGGVLKLAEGWNISHVYRGTLQNGWCETGAADAAIILIEQEAKQ